jgi:iduronate 2-sulfatase
MVQTFSAASLHLFLACFAFAYPSVCSAVDYDVYLLAGQSNMDGRGLVSELSEEQKQPADDAIILAHPTKAYFV